MRSRPLSCGLSPSLTKWGGAVDKRLYRCAIREAQNLQKRRKRMQQRQIAMDAPPDVPSRDPRADELAALGQARVQIALLIALLPDKLKIPLLLHYFHEKTQAEIGQILGCSKITVARRLNSGLSLLLPLAQRAGLADSLRLFIAGGACLSLIGVPSALAASAVYAGASATIAAGATAAAAGSSLWFGQTSLFGVTVMKAKAIGVGIVVSFLLGIGGYFALVDSGPGARDPLAPPAPSGVVDQTAASDTAVNSLAAVEPAAVPAGDLPQAFPSSDRAADQTSAPAPRMPEGPTRAVSVAVHEESRAQAAVAQAEVTIAAAGAGAGEWRATASTDATGSATLIVPQNWTALDIVSRHANYQPASLQFASASENFHVLYLKPGGRIAGRVMLRATGKPVSGAEVRVNEHGSATTTHEGLYALSSLAPGTYNISAVLNQFRSNLTTETEIKLGLGSIVGGVDLYLEQGAGIRGVVTDSESRKPIPGIEIGLYSENSRQRGKTLTNEKGEYEINGLPPGRLLMHATASELVLADSYRKFSSELVLLPEQLATRNFQLDATGRVHVIVQDEKGQPVAGARIELKDRVTAEGFVNYERTDSKGHTLVTDARRAEPPLITASAKEYRESLEKHPVFPSESAETTLTLTLRPIDAENEDEPGLIAGAVSDQEGNPLAGIKLEFQFNSQYFTQTDENGLYQLRTPDQLTSSVVASGQGWGTQVKSTFGLSTLEHPAILNFIMIPPRRVTGFVFDSRNSPIPGLEVGLIAVYMGDVGQKSTTAADGSFVFEGVGDGSLDIIIEQQKYNRFRKPAKFDQPMQIILSEKGMVAGQVISAEDGRPIQQFNVKVHSTGSVRPIGTFFDSPEGMFELTGLEDESQHEIWVESEGHLPSGQQSVKTSTAGGAGLKFELRPEGQIVGRVIDGHGAPIAGASVIYAAHYPSFRIAWERLTYFGDLINPREQLTDSEGRFSFAQAGDWSSVLVRMPGYARSRTTLGPQATADQLANLEIILRPESEIRVVVHSMESPPPGLQLLSEQEGLIEYFDNFNLPHAMEKTYSELAPGQYKLTQTSSQFGQMNLVKHVSLNQGERSQVDMGDQLGNATLHAQLLPTSNGHHPIRVQLTPINSNSAYSEFNIWTRGEREATFNRLPAGAYRLTVYYSDESTFSESIQFGSEVIERVIGIGTTQAD